MEPKREATGAGAVDSQPLFAVGNDVVDLDDADSRGKSSDRRYVERILAREELELFDERCPIKGTAEADAELWRLWSGKEAAFKALVKAIGVRPLAKQLAVSPDHDEQRGSVRFGEHELSLRWDRVGAALHCVAEYGTSTSRDAVTPAEHPSLSNASMTNREASTGTNEHSAAVRELAKQLFRDAAPEQDGRLEILRETRDDAGPLGPPRLFVDASELDGWDVSLSHHGRYVAAALSTKI